MNPEQEITRESIRTEEFQEGIEEALRLLQKGDTVALAEFLSRSVKERAERAAREARGEDEKAARDARKARWKNRPKPDGGNIYG